MSNLSKKLASYYEKRGNKIIFCEKYSLNELAIELWEKLGYKGIDSSSLSRVIKGERLFTAEQLEIFCQVLNINNSNSEELKSALEIDMLTRYGMNPTLGDHHDDSVSLLLESNAAHAKVLRERGLVEYIPGWIESTISLLETAVFSNTDSISTTNKNIQSLANAYFEKAYSYGCIYPGKESYEVVYPIIKRLSTLAIDYKDSHILMKANVLLSFNYYVLGKDGNSLDKKDLFQHGSDSISLALKNNSDSDEISLMAWRCLALNSIYLKDQLTFKFASQKIWAIIARNNEDPNISFIIWALATIARGQSYFNDKNVEQTLDHIKKFNSLIPWSDPLRECALLRNELEILDNLRSKDSTYKISLAKKGLNMSKDLNYIRYIHYFNKYLNL